MRGQSPGASPDRTGGRAGDSGRTVCRTISGVVIAVLGILKAGGAYVPIDPALPAARLRFLMEDSRPSVLLTHDSLIGDLPIHAPHVICLDCEDFSASSAAILPAGNWREPGLCDLHIRIDGYPQGGRTEPHAD